MMYIYGLYDNMLMIIILIFWIYHSKINYLDKSIYPNYRTALIHGYSTAACTLVFCNRSTITYTQCTKEIHKTRIL